MTESRRLRTQADAHGNVADDCGHCTLLPGVNGPVRAVQTGCPEHGDWVRTQAERDADGTTWRATAASRPGYATYPDTAPGSPCWWQRNGEMPPAKPAPEIRPWTGPDPMISGRIGPRPADVMAALDAAQQMLAELPPPITCLRMHPAAYGLLAARAASKPMLGGPPADMLGLPIIEDTDLPYGAWHLEDADGQVVKRGQFRMPLPDPEIQADPTPPHVAAWLRQSAADSTPAEPDDIDRLRARIRPPRRRWWHRYTRRTR